MKNILFSIFSRRAKKYLKKDARVRRFVSYDKSKSILLLFNCNNKNENKDIKEIINRLKMDGKNVEAIGFCEDKNYKATNTINLQILTKKDTDLYNKPKQNIISNLKSKKFDIAIDLTTSQLIPLMYLALYSDVPFKVGTRRMKPEIYDFILDISNQNISHKNNLESSEGLFLLNEIFFYLKDIKSKD